MNDGKVNKNCFNLKNISIISLLLIPIFLSVIVYSYGLNGNDFWWHIKVGEWICKNNALPSSDIFSWYGIINHITWRSQEWLSDLIFYLIYNQFGEKGFLLFCILFDSLFLSLIIGFNYRYIKSRFMFSVFFIIFTSICFLSFIYGRPQIFSGLLLFIQLCLLYKYYISGNIKLIIPIPFLTVLWSNMHGGSANLSYIICFIFFLVSLCPYNGNRVVSLKKEKRIKISLAVLTFVCVLAIFVNPQGMYVFIYPYENMSNTFMLNVISEWASPDAKNLGQIVFYFFPMLVFILCVVLRKKKILLIDGVLILLFLFLFLRSTRFVFYLYIAISVFGYKYFPICKLKITKFSCLLTVSVSFIFIIYSSVCLFNAFNKDQIIKRVLDYDYCKIIKEDNIQRIYNDYNYAEALIYNDIKCFVDARVDLFADNIFEDSINLCNLTDMNSSKGCFEPEKIIDKYKFDAIIIQTDRPLKAFLDAKPDEYSLIKSDDNTAYYHINRFYCN